MRLLLRALSHLVLLVSAVCFADDPSRCQPETAGERKLYRSDFYWGITFKDMMVKYDHLYNSGKRLRNRAYWDGQASVYKLPFEFNFGGEVVLPKSFIEATRHHIERALERRYVDAVFFADMGHSHFFIPEEKYEKVYKPIPPKEMNRLYEKLLSDSEAVVLYHTAEQLESSQDRHDLWRFFTRNLLGENKKGGEVYVLPAVEQSRNTLHNLPGYRYWGAGINVSASVDGCFEFFDGKMKRYFDLSLYDLDVKRTDPLAPIFVSH